VLVGVVGLIFLGLLIGGVRAVGFASRWGADHPDEDIRNEPLDGLGPAQRFFARLPLAFWPWARPLFVAYLALYAMLLVVLINAGLFVRVMRVPTSSMEPVIRSREQAIVLKSWIMGSLQRGDLVVFAMPYNRSEHYVKRIVGVPGDRLHLHDKQLILNGHPLTETYVEHIAANTNDYRDNFPSGAIPDFARYADAVTTMIEANVRNGELVVPPGFYFVLGDNRDSSLDSRYFGPIPQNDIIGRPIFVSGAKRGLRSLPRIRIGA
jgi:signal peptidase I